MTQYGKLYGHKGCVNTVCFNFNGDVLVSGSDDKDIIFWDWQMRRKMSSYNSGHNENVLQARIMPFSDDRTVISSGADGQVTIFLFIFYYLMTHQTFSSFQVVII